ncbi:hypothetical protein FJ365_01905 [Candidatus Dependentiae bacterium]|nr:hypothetical protein [Candidatus Dependentiae bacterium]
MNIIHKALFFSLLGLLGSNLYTAAPSEAASATRSMLIDCLSSQDEALDDGEIVPRLDFSKLTADSLSTDNSQRAPISSKRSTGPRCSPFSSRSTPSSARLSAVSRALKAEALEAEISLTEASSAQDLLCLLSRFSPPPGSPFVLETPEDNTINKIKNFLVAGNDDLNRLHTYSVKLAMIDNIKDFLEETYEFELTPFLEEITKERILEKQPRIYRLDNIGLRFKILRKSLEAELRNINSGCWDDIEKVIADFEAKIRL